MLLHKIRIIRIAGRPKVGHPAQTLRNTKRPWSRAGHDDRPPSHGQVRDRVPFHVYAADTH